MEQRVTSPGMAVAARGLRRFHRGFKTLLDQVFPEVHFFQDQVAPAVFLEYFQQVKGKIDRGPGQAFGIKQRFKTPSLFRLAKGVGQQG